LAEVDGSESLVVPNSGSGAESEEARPRIHDGSVTVAAAVDSDVMAGAG